MQLINLTQVFHLFEHIPYPYRTIVTFTFFSLNKLLLNLIIKKIIIIKRITLISGCFLSVGKKVMQCLHAGYAALKCVKKKKLKKAKFKALCGLLSILFSQLLL